MAFTLTASSVRFLHREWSMEGRTGVSHTLTLADGDDLFSVKVPQDVLDVLDSQTIDALGRVGFTVEVDLAEPRAYVNDGRPPRVVLRARRVRVAELAGK